MRFKILVTGGSGVVGSALKSLKFSYPLFDFVFSDSKACDLTDEVQTHHYVRSVEPNAIIHLAAYSGGIGLSMQHPAKLLRGNVLMCFNILEAARIHKVEKVVMTLTTGMYPPNAPLPLKEESIHDGYPHDSNYGSSFAKRLVDPAIRAYREEYGMNIIGLIPNGIYGECDNFHLEHAPMVPALIRRFYDSRESDSDIVVWGDGSPLREYTYSKDVAKAFMWGLLHYNDAQVLNIGSTEELSVREIAYLIAEYLDIDKQRIKFDASKPGGVFKKSTDNSRFLELSGFQYTPFREGLQNTIKWFCSAYRDYPDFMRLESKMNEVS